MNRRELMKVGVAGVVAALCPLHVWASGSTPTLLSASVAGSRVGKGKATYASNAGGSEKELEIELERIGLPVGTVLTATIAGVTVGTLTVFTERGTTKAKLKLKSQSGQTVPTVIAGDVINILNATETAATGTFATGGGSGGGGGGGGGGTPPVLYLTAVTGALIGKGKAKYQANAGATQKELEIELEKIRLPVGTVLSVTIAGVAVGSMTVFIEKKSTKAKLKLKTSLGQTVPTVIHGNIITILNGVDQVGNGTF